MNLRSAHATLGGLLLLGITACGPDTDTTSEADPSTDGAEDVVPGGVMVEVRDNRFTPEGVGVAIGETVTWNFATADQAHDVVFSSDRGSDILESGTWSTSFDEAGTYPYECTLHAGMQGEVTVLES